MIDGKQLKNNSIRESKFNIQADFSANGFKISNIANPIADQDAATKRYVDAVSQGLIIKDACKVATNSSVDLTGFIYNNITDKWTNVTSPVFDSISVSNLERVLIKNASDGRGNGIWVFYSVNNEFRRSEDSNNYGAPSLSELRGGCFTFVTRGTVNADTGWVISSPDANITLGTDYITWSQFSGAGSITAGAGLTKTGSTLNVNSDNLSIDVFGDQIRIKPGGVSGSKLATSVAGEGLILNGISNALDVNVDNSTIEIYLDFLRVKENGIGLTEIDTTVFGNGFSVSTNITLNIGQAFQFSGAVLNAKLNSNGSLVVDANGLNASSISEIYDTPLASSGEADFNTGITIASTPAGNSMIIVYLNGIKEDISYGAKTGTFWIEPAGGGTARTVETIIATDELHFSAVTAEYDLEVDDEIELIFSKIQ